MKKLYCLGLCWLIAVASHAETSVEARTRYAENTLNTLFSVIDERLAFMQDVAAWKWQNQRPIEDLARERVVLEAAVQQATDIGLDAAHVRAFFAAQLTRRS